MSEPRLLTGCLFGAAYSSEVSDDEIIVTLPDTDYLVTYYRPAYSRYLLTKRLTNEDDPTAPMTSGMSSLFSET